MTFPVRPILVLCAILVVAGCHKEDGASGTVPSMPSSVSTPALCTIRGTVRYRDRTLAYPAVVELVDGSVPDETRKAICASGGDSICKETYFTEEDGHFSVTGVVMENLLLGAMSVRKVTPEKGDIENAGRTFSSCPTAPVALTLDPAYAVVLFMVRVQRNVISWKPVEHGITTVKVMSPAGLKWEIHSAAGKLMSSPVVYGMVPPGATQAHPVRGTPAPLAPGDVVAVSADGSNIEGVPHTGSGDFLIGGPTVGPLEQISQITDWVGRIYAQLIGANVRAPVR